MMPNANRRRGAYSGWTRRRGAGETPPESRPRLDFNLRRSAPRESPVETFPRARAGEPEAANKLDKVVIFCLDETGRVLTSGEMAYISREDLTKRLAEDVRRYPVVEAWQGCICLLRLGGPAWPDAADDEV